MEHARARLIAPGARDDKVTRRVVRALEERTAAYVPDGMLLVYTLGAPIRTPKKLVDTLTRHFREALGRDLSASDETATIHDNRVRFRIVERGNLPLRVIGFVFTSDPGLDVLIAGLSSG